MRRSTRIAAISFQISTLKSTRDRCDFPPSPPPEHVFPLQTTFARRRRARFDERYRVAGALAPPIASERILLDGIFSSKLYEILLFKMQTQTQTHTRDIDIYSCREETH